MLTSSYWNKAWTTARKGEIKVEERWSRGARELGLVMKEDGWYGGYGGYEGMEKWEKEKRGIWWHGKGLFSYSLG